MCTSGQHVGFVLKKRFLLLLAPIFLLASAGPAFAIQAFHLVQHAQIAGTYDVYLTNFAFKAVNPKTGLTLYSRAPDWQLLICNARRQVFTTMPPSQFTGRLARAIENFDTERFDNLKWKVIGKGDVVGLPVTNARVQIKESLFRVSDDPRRNNRLWTAEYSAFDQFKIPEAVCHALQRHYGLPIHHGIPVRCAYLDFNGEKTTALDTFKFNKVDVDMAYDQPANYKRVKGELEVLANDNASGLEFFRP